MLLETLQIINLWKKRFIKQQWFIIKKNEIKKKFKCVAIFHGHNLFDSLNVFSNLFFYKICLRISMLLWKGQTIGKHIFDIPFRCKYLLIHHP